MEQLEIKLDMRPHTTRLKQRLLTEFTDMQTQKKGRDILLAFENDIGPVLAKACEIDSDSDAIILAHAERLCTIICLRMPNHYWTNRGLPERVCITTATSLG